MPVRCVHDYASRRITSRLHLIFGVMTTSCARCAVAPPPLSSALYIAAVRALQRHLRLPLLPNNRQRGAAWASQLVAAVAAPARLSRQPGDVADERALIPRRAQTASLRAAILVKPAGADDIGTNIGIRRVAAIWRANTDLPCLARSKGDIGTTR
jgi:hypothetical protein